MKSFIIPKSVEGGMAQFQNYGETGVHVVGLFQRGAAIKYKIVKLILA